MFKRIVLLPLSIILFFTVNLYAREGPYDKMAKELSEASKILEQPKVAIIPFSYLDKRESDGGAIIAERLTTRIVKLGKLQVVERQLLEKVLQELHLEMTGIVDVKTTKQLGKVLGVDAIITGTLMDVKRNRVEVNARVINTETAEVIATSFVKIKKIWSDAPVPQAQPTTRQPLPRQPGYQPPSPTYEVRPKPDLFLDIFLGSGSGKMDLFFENSTYGIDEIDLSLDFDGDGILEHSVDFREIEFNQLETEDTSLPFGFRLGFFTDPGQGKLRIGADLEISYITHNQKIQRTRVILDGGSTSEFRFFVDDYLKISILTLLSGDILLELYDETFRPYIGLGLGMTLNTVKSPYIYQYHGGSFRKPLDEMSVGFLYRIPIGLRIMINESSSIFGEFRISGNTFSFDRNIKNETDKITISLKQFFLGMGFGF